MVLRSVLTLFVLALIAAVPARGLADESAAKAKGFFKDGQKHFKSKNYKKALELFQKAHSLHPHPDIVFMVGQANRNLEHYIEAIEAFREYLNLKPEAEDRGEVERLIEELEFLQEAKGGESAGEEDKPAGPDEEEASGGTEAAAPAAKAGPTPMPEPTSPKAPRPLTPPPSRDRPVYKTWWFWTAIVGGLAVVGGASYLIARETSAVEPPAGSLGTLDLR